MRKDVTSDPAVAAAILGRAEMLHLALCDAAGPLAVTVNFVFHGGRILVHSAFKGRKAQALLRGGVAAFCAQVDVEKKRGDTACAWGYRFRSVMGQGLVRAVDDPQQKMLVLRLFAEKYTDGDSAVDERIAEKTAVFAIEPAALTARLKGYEA